MSDISACELGIQPARFYRWYDRLQTGGLEALEDKASRPTRVWNRIPDAIRERIVQLALDEPELSPRELATRFTDTANYFVSEASVYRLLKAHDLITSPAYIVMKAAEPHKLKQDEPVTPVVHTAICLKAFDDGHATVKAFIIANFMMTNSPGSAGWQSPRYPTIA